MKFPAAVVLGMSLISVPATAGQDAPLPSKLVRISSASAHAAVDIRDDRLEPEITLSTEPVYKGRRGLVGYMLDDTFLKARIDRNSGQVRFEVHQWMRYLGNLRGYEQVNFLTPDGLKQKRLDESRYSSETCPQQESLIECVFTEHLAFSVDENLLRRLAGASAPQDGWRFRFKASNGQDFNAVLMPAEIAGLLKAVDAKRARLAMAEAPAAGRM